MELNKQNIWTNNTISLLRIFLFNVWWNTRYALALSGCVFFLPPLQTTKYHGKRCKILTEKAQFHLLLGKRERKWVIAALSFLLSPFQSLKGHYPHNGTEIINEATSQSLSDMLNSHQSQKNLLAFQSNGLPLWSSFPLCTLGGTPKNCRTGNAGHAGYLYHFVADRFT